MGPAAALLELVEVGALELLVSDACTEELREVLTRPSFHRSRSLPFKTFLTEFRLAPCTP